MERKSCAQTRLGMHAILAFMNSSTLFVDLEQQDRINIASCALIRYLQRNEYLFLQGHPVCNFIVLRSGCVKLIQVSPNGNEALVRINNAGDVVNFEGASLRCHSCSAQVIETGEALIWDHRRIQTLFASYPRLRDNFNRKLVSRLEDLEERFREMITEKVEGRLALLLLRLSKQIGKTIDHGVQVSLRREELAQMTGANLYTISRVLSRWSEKGLVLARREAVIIPDPYRLGSALDQLALGSPARASATSIALR